MRRAPALGALALACAAACGNDAKTIDAAGTPPIDAKILPTIDAPVDAKLVPAIDAPVDAKPPDAAVDAKPSSVQLVACNTVSKAKAISATNFAFSPTPVTITATDDSAISYTTAAGSHGMVNDTGTDAFSTGILGAGDPAKCLKFTMPGT
jgi:hypothetical protein